ncbi:MAG: hypothetical protein HDT47_06635 [Ruminococcaceae bacterium]|nr:hypothetical protein [Oscillospiraceae bacterium]
MNDLNQNQYQVPENPQDITDNNGLQNNFPENTAGQVGFYESSEYISPVYVTKKRGVNPLAIILPVTAVIIAAVVVFVLLMLNKPVSYQEAEKNFFGGLFSAAEQTEDAVYGQLGSEKLTVDFSTPLGDLAGIDLSEYKLEIDTASGETAAYAIVKAMLGEDINLNAEMWLDRAGSQNYILLPEISDIYLMQDYSDSTQTAEDYADYAESLQEVFEKTSEVYFEIVGDPEVERNVEFTVSNVTYTADRTVIHLDISQLATIVKAFVENMAENSKTAELLCRIGEYDTVDEMREALKEFADTLQESIDGTGDADGALDMVVYIKNNTVIGREIVVSDYGIDEKLFFDLYQIPTENGENGYFRFKNTDADSYEVSELTFSYNDEAEGDLHRGTLSLDVTEDDETVSVKASYNSLSFAEESFGGAIDITLKNNQQSDFMDIGGQTDYSVKIDLAKETDKKAINITVPNICTVRLVSEPSDLEFKSVPSPDPSKIAVINGDFEESDALEQFLDDLLNYFYPSYDEPDYDVNDYPYFPEVTEAENDPTDMSVIAGDWAPVKMEIVGEEHYLDSEELGSYMKGLTYSFWADGVLIVTDAEADITEEYNCYFDSTERNHILLEDNIYYSIYYDEITDTFLFSDNDGLIMIWFERK